MNKSPPPRDVLPPSQVPAGLRVGVHMRTLPTGEYVLLVDGVEKSRHTDSAAAWDDYWALMQAHLDRKAARGGNA